VTRKISDSTVRRLSLYLRILEALEREGIATVSSEDLAGRSGTTAAQVRKDLSHFGSFGKRGLGYAVRDLREHLQRIMGLERRWRVVLVGAGRIGSALFDYAGFRSRGFDIVAVLDADASKVGQRWGEVVIGDSASLEDIIRRHCVDVAIVAVPVEAVQGVVDRVVSAGVRGILNFAPTRLRVPEGVALKDVSLVMELEALSFSLSRHASLGP
jgi:redox-sensing transcriptional repressor